MKIALYLVLVALLSGPIRSKIKTNRDSLTRVFPRFALATCSCFEIWLAHWTVKVLCDWPQWLLWLCFATLSQESLCARVFHLNCYHICCHLKIITSAFYHFSPQCVFPDSISLWSLDGQQVTVFCSWTILEMFQTLGSASECPRATGEGYKNKQTNNSDIMQFDGFFFTSLKSS